MSGRDTVAILLALCDERTVCLAKQCASSEACGPKDLTSSAVFRRAVAPFTRATHALLELHYFDADHRSNTGVGVLHRHVPTPAIANRLVFLDLDPKLLKIDPVAAVGAATTAGADGKPQKGHAYGYVVVTPDASGPVGRSIIPAPETIEGLADGVEIADHVRTAVREVVSPFGHRLQVMGIPFIQQDDHTFSCAHAAVWMSHYSAVLRGLAGRRLSAQLHSSLDATLQYGRLYPSMGLTAFEANTVLAAAGLPTLTLDINEFDKGRLARWYDRQQIVDDTAALRAITKVESEKYTAHRRELDRLTREHIDESFDPAPEHTNFWIRENLTRTVCQYLNSGFPCILMMDRHAVVLTGYLRARDWPAGSPQRETYSDGEVVSFLTADDETGPYEVWSVSSVVSELMNNPDTTTVLVPLPPAIWVSAARAESVGAQAVRWGARVAIASLHKQAKSLDATTVSQVETKLQPIVDAAALGRIDRQTPYALRSYVVPSTDFKNGFASRRKTDKEAVRQVRLADLPRFVWVVEVLVRNKHHKKAPSVVAEVVIDTTDVSLDESRALITHLPGAIQVLGPTNGPGDWTFTGVTSLYASGRYHGSNDWSHDPMAVTARAKLANG